MEIWTIQNIKSNMLCLPFYVNQINCSIIAQRRTTMRCASCVMTGPLPKIKIWDRQVIAMF